ncbi:MAG: cysteine--1-D-myo-inosityl 2-amino-2-deoxy-alpha-D-glucopyranoside ligase [Mycobacteriales bacterium]|nr:MAG: cysteine--1-D-myo-inosityl 2-amino-2-deoxy-alpha-D-glucopyranoside ligase [Pseudonocardiales bacterium]
MRSWPAPDVPRLPGRGSVPALHDTATGSRVAVSGDAARLYVCGVTPYDATHIGHAATYLAFDLLNRAWRDAGITVRYAQNVTDVDDPLLERAERDGEKWEDLAARQTQLFRDDMAALRALPPDHYVGAVEAIPRIAEEIARLVGSGAAYPVDDDVYFCVGAAPEFGYESHLDAAAMLRVFGENGGDPDRAGKKNPLDPLLWRAARPGEPSWPSPLGPGRPGWHIECAVIAIDALGSTVDVQGGGRDLVFPHHEMSAAHAEVLTGERPFARCYSHVGMTRLNGEKMSKSRGNLAFVSALRSGGVDPSAIRLALLAGDYRADCDWRNDVLAAAVFRLQRWRKAATHPSGPSAKGVLDQVRAALADDLDSPRALAAIDAWADAVLAAGGSDAPAPALVRDIADALLGVQL